MSVTLGIIGTAGRKEDAAKLDASHWRMMVCISQTVATVIGATRLVSGGAAWADAVAVDLFNRGFVSALTLHLPAPFLRTPERYAYKDTDAGRVSDRYHVAFTEARKAGGVPGISLVEIANAIQKPGCTVTEDTGSGYAPFFIRNGMVADDSDVMLAFTFGRTGEPQCKDGGTADTMAKFLKRVPARDYNHSNGCPSMPLLRAFHFNLTDRCLYCLT